MHYLGVVNAERLHATQQIDTSRRGEMSSLKVAELERFYFVMVVDGAEFDESNYEDKLYEAGCDDALVTIIDSIIKVEFEREAESFHDAVYSAVKDVTKAGGKVCKIERFVNREDGRRDVPAYQPIQRMAS